MRQTVDVLIGATLPWAAWVAEVDCMPSAVKTRAGAGCVRASGSHARLLHSSAGKDCILRMMVTCARSVSCPVEQVQKDCEPGGASSSHGLSGHGPLACT